MHRFFGAVSPRTLRPDATFRDLRDADGDTGNVEENRSLYWNPVIYKVATVSTVSKGFYSIYTGYLRVCLQYIYQVVNPESPLTRSFEIVDTWFASAYYVFRTGTGSYLLHI